MENGQVIRDIQSGDIQKVVDIYNHYVLHTTVSYEEVPVPVDEIRARVDKVQSAGFPWLVLDQQGELLGYSYAYYWNLRSAYRHTAETTVYLRHDATGQGLGRQLYNALFERLRERGIRTVIGGIGLPNEASIALHEIMGMQKVAHFPAVGFKFGQWLDVGYWQGELDNVLYIDE